ncbi:MAG: hypothetical protein JSS87_07595 [Acidobacteria bacterium]|nr:hypothetical protein [Acidobacteriota bacterium]
MTKRVAVLLLLATPLLLAAQTPAAKKHKHMPPEMNSGDMPMKHAPAARSNSIFVTGLDGATATFSPDDLKSMPRVALKVHNAHTDAEEIYEGVPVSEFLKRVQPQLSGKKISRNITVLLFGATDNFHVVLTACDVDPKCHNGTVLIADTMNGKPLEADGAFKLIISEDKKAGRWVHNLNSITVKAIQ